MIPHHRLTIIRNRHRARELREFRGLVEDYFARLERDADGVPMDWDGAQVARSQINQRLARVVQVVRAAGIEGPHAPHLVTDPGPMLGRVEVLQRIFTAHHVDGLEQEVYDILDMAIGVYDSERAEALLRTVNPLHYLGVAIAFLMRGPRRVLGALGMGRSRGGRVTATELGRLEAAVARLARVEDLIDDRFAQLQDRQAARQAEEVRQLAELAERLDFAERVLAQGRPPERLGAPPKRSGVVTPV